MRLINFTPALLAHTRSGFTALLSVCSIALMLSSAVTLAAKQSVKIGQGTDANSAYVLELLGLVFAELQNDFMVDYVGDDDLVSVSRMIEATSNGALDIVWLATNNDIEDKLIPVRIPLFMGMLGYRINLVHKDRRNVFSQVSSFSDLQDYSFGQGRGWTDTTILQANGLNVVQANKWMGLFFMTDGGRFDAYPRGLHEPWGEMEMLKNLDLVVEPNIVLVYRMPFYLFINPNKPELARAVEAKLEEMVSDKRLQSYFLQNEFVSNAITLAELDKRKFFYLENPAAPPKTPVDRKELWLESLNLF